MKKNVVFVMIAGAILAFLTGCATTLRYNPSYIENTLPSGIRVTEGQVLIYTQSTDDKYVFEGSPSSFTGAATSIKIPLGIMTKEIASEVFGKMFAEGCDFRNDIPTESIYNIILNPKVTLFDYKYNQLKNLGFAITPQVQIVLVVNFYGKDGVVAYSKEYDSGIVDGNAYLVNLTPAEAVNRVAHTVLYDLMLKAARDTQFFMYSKKVSKIKK